MTIKNLDQLTFTFVNSEEFVPIFKELRPKLFEENNDIIYSTYWSDEEKEKFKKLQQQSSKENYYHYFTNEKVGNIINYRTGQTKGVS